VGELPPLPLFPLPPLLTPPHDRSNKISGVKSTVARIRPRFRFRVALGDSPKKKNRGNSNNAEKKIEECPAYTVALLDFVEMLITTSTAELPGVIGPEGLKLHCACGGRPDVHASETAALKDAPIGCTVKLYGPLVCPAVTVWLGVEDLTRKSCSSVSAMVAA
jgi:hypothetical protein